jgi:hypothetical protein
MNRMPMSAAASALLRTLIGRAGVARNRILLIDVQSVDWRSLTFTGERHVMELCVAGPASLAVVERMCGGLEEFEFTMPGIIVADIAVSGTRRHELDGSIAVTIEALTVTED